MEEDNFDDNAFAWFNNYRNAKSGEPLYDKGMFRSKNVVEEFKADWVSGKLPQVSIIIAPAWQSEHAENHPQDGEELSQQLISVLPLNKDMYAKTAFILNYDEGGQFCDHHWTPTPPRGDYDGASTVTTKGEITTGAYATVPSG